jgi:hypothetical protein
MQVRDSIHCVVRCPYLEGQKEWGAGAGACPGSLSVEADPAPLDRNLIREREGKSEEQKLS